VLLSVVVTVQQSGRAQVDYDADDNSEDDDVDDVSDVNDDDDDDDDDGRRQIYSHESCSPAADSAVAAAAWSVQARDTDRSSGRRRPVKPPAYIDHDEADVDMKESSDSEEIAVNEGVMVRRAGSRLTYVEDDVMEHRAVRQRSSDRTPRGKADAATHRQVTNISPLQFYIISAISRNSPRWLFYTLY